MPVSSTPALISGIARQMKALSQRQQVIAQNLANSETPGFKARETVGPDFSALLAAQGEGGLPRIARPQVRISSGMAALGAHQPNGGSIIADADTGETKPDGNNVVLEEQMLKLGQVQSDFAAVTSIYRKQMGLLKTATGRGGV
jgi:flagellar basal-body rod protein FlgB